jgi:hypothetical protein
VSTAEQLVRLRAWQRLLDEAFPIPGTRYRFGWDAIIGLVPGAGDLIAGLCGVVILYHAHRMHVPRVILTRMVINLVIDLVIGIVPFAGDVADIFWKANTRNLALLERHVVHEQPPTGGDYLFVGGVALVLAAIAALPLVLVFLLGRTMGGW